MEFNRQLENLNNTREALIIKKNEINAQLKREVNESKSFLQKVYSEDLSVVSESIKEITEKINSKNKRVVSYSDFDVRNIGKIIASLITEIEGVVYSYQDDALYYATEVRYEYSDYSINENKRNHPRLVIKESCKSEEYSQKQNDLWALSKNGSALLLVKDLSTEENRIPFYSLSKDENELESTVDYQNFDYVKEFIDLVISYKIEHSIEDITLIELEKLKYDFINSKKEELKMNLGFCRNHIRMHINRKGNN